MIREADHRVGLTRSERSEWRGARVAKRPQLNPYAAYPSSGGIGDGWPSGLRRTIGNRVGSRPRGFESHPVRIEFLAGVVFGGSRTHAAICEADRSVGSSRATVVRLVPEIVSGAWLSPVERCVRVAEVPGSNPGAPIRSKSSAARSTLVVVRALLFGALAERYCTRLESERPKGLGGSNPSRSVSPSGSLGLEGFLFGGGPWPITRSMR